MTKKNGYVLWEGKSELDRKPIMVIATGFKVSKNRKTGKMIQIWIMRRDINPLEAARFGKDASICGNCRHRPSSKYNPKGWGTCYVHLGQAPNQVWKGWRDGKYRPMEHADWKLFEGRRVRLGAYGDPAAVPIEVWHRIIGICDYHTGYTHQWATCDEAYQQICMASVDTPQEHERAQRLGWRTFRVRMEDEALAANERVCPASDEAGKRVSCEQCMACHGGTANEAGIAIVVHGGNWKPDRFIQLRVRQKNHKPTLPVIEEAWKNRVLKNRYYKGDVRIDVVRDGKGNVVKMIRSPRYAAVGCS